MEKHSPTLQYGETFSYLELAKIRADLSYLTAKVSVLFWKYLRFNVARKIDMALIAHETAI